MPLLPQAPGKLVKEPFVDHFRQKYGDGHDMLPVWMAAEIMSFGTILTFYKGSSHKVKQATPASAAKRPGGWK
jgi:abortive infection bacteriophage resistance protein